MKKVIVFLALLLIVPFISADLVITQQPNEVYNLGDIVNIPITVKSLTDISGILEMDFICGGRISNFYKNGVSLISGEEKKFESSLVLTGSVIGELRGTCKVKAFVGEEFILTDDFKVSDLITINPNFESLELVPDQNLVVEGNAFKENGKDVNGFIELSIIEGNSSIISQLETINNGFFSINLSLPKEMKAGAYLVELNGYEMVISGEKTNNGFVNQNILVNQVPTSLEIVFENSEIEPGTEVKIKTVLHDQTGEKINSTSYLTIRDGKGKIMEQMNTNTDKFLFFPISYNEEPSAWGVLAESNQLTTESKFIVLEKAEISTQILNQTLTITNVGNVLYNKTALVKLGNESLNIDVLLEVGKSQKYVLSAPDGQYIVEVIADGEVSSTETILTGNTINIKKASGAVGSLVKYPFVWIFVIAILGFATFVVFRKGYQKSFVGYITTRMKERKNNKEDSDVKFSPHSKKSLINSKSKGEVSLSIKGDRQNVSVVTLNIKNLNEIQGRKSNAEETLEKVIDVAESEKAVVHESGGVIFFILAPAKTRTFKNERTALKIAQGMKKVLEEHNKSFKQKINFGISLNYGTIVAKQDQESFKFMSMGTLMNVAKKISSLSHGEILLGEKINERLRAEIKTTKHERGNSTVYSIKEIKNVEDNERFVRSFLERIGKDKK